MGLKLNNTQGNLENIWMEWKWKHNVLKSVGHNQSSTYREIYSITCFYRKEEMSGINNLSLHSKKLEKRTN